MERILQIRDNSEMDSNEYEWDNLSDVSYEDIQIDIIKKYTPKCEEGQSSSFNPIVFET